ncbi:MAG: fructosamine kinase family protein [Planctomycetota bacterium]
MDIHAFIENHFHSAPERVTALGGGCIADVRRIDLRDGRSLVVKIATSGYETLDIEGNMLGYLATHSSLPVPKVFVSQPDALAMEWIDGEAGGLGQKAQSHAAELIAGLHSQTADQFGFDRDTLIGPLRQPNPWTESWIEFFREQRLLLMARIAYDAGRFGADDVRRFERFAARLDEWLTEPPQPALLHGDLWGGNILMSGDRVVGFIDPAIYYGHPEMDLAFSTLFGTFGDSFFSRYQEIAPLDDGFFETRRDIYNLYPLLVHTRLFGGGYRDQALRILSRLGF